MVIVVMIVIVLMSMVMMVVLMMVVVMPSIVIITGCSVKFNFRQVFHWSHSCFLGLLDAFDTWVWEGGTHHQVRKKRKSKEHISHPALGAV